MNLLAKTWNEMYPIGTPVRCWSYLLDNGRPYLMDTRTRSEAWDTDAGDTLVSCERVAGGLCVRHLMPRLET